ncbi:MAG: hypothetical protein ACI82S_002543 [Patiriisocius sp.]|jgi:hypothetical protein
MVEFIFIVSCLVFISTITWLSYKLGETKSMNAKTSCILGFFLSFLPPIALLYIGFLAFREGAPTNEPRLSD